MRYDFTTSMPREHTRAIKYTRKMQLFGTENVLPMWVADMDIDTPSFVIEALQKRLEFPNFGYETIPDSMFEAQIEWMQRHHGITWTREELLYSPSVVATIHAAIEAFSSTGDKIIVQPPVYPPFFKSIAEHDREVLFNPLAQDADGRYSFDIEDLLSKIDEKTKLLILCSPHNPVGRVWSKEELESIAEVCLKHNVIVFSDEIHSDLVYEPHKHIPFASLSDAVREITITAFGTGKTFNMASFSISIVAISSKILREKFQKVYDRIHFSQATALGHVAMESAYTNGDAWLRELKAHLIQNIAMLEEVCTAHAEKITFVKPEGTYLAWLDCAKMGLSDKKLRDFFVNEAKLGLSSGISFSKEGSGYMRLNFAVSEDIMKRAVTQLDHALEEFHG